MNTGAMIALLPYAADYVQQPLPHMTLAYCGPFAELSDSAFNEMGKDAISVSRIMSPSSFQVTDVDVFGEGMDMVDVVKIYPTPQLLVARKLVEHWDKSEFPFKPHVTIGPAGSAQGNIPTSIYFDRIAVVWGDRLLAFPLMY